MGEKILIESKINKTVKNVIMGIVIAFFVISAFLFLLILSKVDYSSDYYYSAHHEVFDIGVSDIVVIVIACVSFVCGIISLIVFLAHNKCLLIVTDKNVKGRAIFGKEVVLMDWGRGKPKAAGLPVFSFRTGVPSRCILLARWKSSPRMSE